MVWKATRNQKKQILKREVKGTEEKRVVKPEEMTQDKTSRYGHPSQTTSLQALHEAPTSNPQKTFRRRPLGLEEIPVSVLDFNKELHSLC